MPAPLPIFGSPLRRTPRAARLTWVRLALPPLLLAAHAGSSPPASTPARSSAGAPAVYRNPLVADVADPFVLKHRGEYYLYRTTVNNRLDVLLSRDLVHWRQGPVVWQPEGPEAGNVRSQWAPEVYYENGKFLLLFSANPRTSDDHRLWLATADRPTGPFRIQPAEPLTAPWRIDPHLFVDDDGARYLYCCHKAERGARVEGRRLPEGEGTLDEVWSVMAQPEREWEGIWIEAPTILKDRSTFFLLYSGPDAESARYQVGYATASHPLGPWRKQGILISNVPGVPGPGHQCVVLAPDNLTPYLLYHRKRLAERGWLRDLMLDRLAIRDGRLSTRAPTQTPQPLPPRPAFEEHFDSAESLRSWTLAAGSWRVDPREHEMVQSSRAGSARARLAGLPIHDGVIEVNVRRTGGEGSAGLRLVSGSRSVEVALLPDAIRIGAKSGGVGERKRGGVEEESPALALSHSPALPFRPDVYHQLLLVRAGGKVEVRLDGRRVGESALAAGPAALELITRGCGAAFSGIAVTPYTTPLPLPPPEPELQVGWHRAGDRIEHRLLDAPMRFYALPELSRDFSRTRTLAVQVQGWALGTRMRFPKYGVRLRTRDRRSWVEGYLDPRTGVLATHGSIGGRELPWRNSLLPPGFDYTEWHTLSVRRTGDMWRFSVDGKSDQFREAPLRGEIEPALGAEDARAVFRIPRVNLSPAGPGAQAPARTAVRPDPAGEESTPPPPARPSASGRSPRRSGWR